MIRFVILLSVFIFYSSAVKAEIISIINNGSAVATSNQPKAILADYLKIRLFRETVDRSIDHIKTMPEFKDTEANMDDLKFIAVLVSKLSVIDTTFSTENGKLKVSMRLKVELDSSTVNRYLEKSLENNQFKAFGRQFLENLLTIETQLLTAETDKDSTLKKEVKKLFGIQRARSYEMNELSLNAFNENSTGSDQERQISAAKEKFVNAILADMSAYEEEQQKEIQDMLNSMAKYAKERLATLKSIEAKYEAMPYQFNTSSEHDIISAKNEMITTRKKIQNLTKSFFYDTDMIKKSIDAGYDNISKYLETVKFYDVDPIKDRWESSYHYAYRLNNYQTRINKTDLFISNNQKRIYELKYRADKVVKINSLVSLLKILQPYENHLTELQEDQYEGAARDDVYVLKVGPADNKAGVLPINVRFQGMDYTLDFDISKSDATKLKYYIDRSKYFAAYPLYRLTSTGIDPYDILAVHSGFLIIHRGDKSKQKFLTNTRLQPFPETLYSDEFKQILLKERAELKQRSSEPIDIESSFSNQTHNNQYFAVLPLTKVSGVFSTPVLYAQADIADVGVNDPPPPDNQQVIINEPNTDDSAVTEPNSEDNRSKAAPSQDNKPITTTININEDMAATPITPREETIETNANLDNLTFESYIFKDELDNITTAYEETQPGFMLKRDSKIYKGSISLLLGTSNRLGFTSQSNARQQSGLFGVKGQYHIGYFAVEPSIIYLNSGPGYASLSNYKVTRFDYLVSFLFEYPIYLRQDMMLLPYIGPGVGLSSLTFRTITADNFIAKERIITNTLLLSAKVGVRYTYSNFLVGIGVQFNRAVPVVVSRPTNFSNYSFFFEIGYAILKNREKPNGNL